MKKQKEKNLQTEKTNFIADVFGLECNIGSFPGEAAIKKPIYAQK